MRNTGVFWLAMVYLFFFIGCTLILEFELDGVTERDIHIALVGMGFFYVLLAIMLWQPKEKDEEIVVL